MTPRVRIFLDTSALYAAIHSDSGGARLILKLGEARAVRVVVGPRVLAELDGVVARKAPDLRPIMAMLLDASDIEIGPAAMESSLAMASQAIPYLPDAHVLAEALAADVAYFVSLDKAHFVGNPALLRMAFPIGTPGDCLAWLRTGIMSS